MPGTAQCHHMSTLIFSTTLKVMIASYWRANCLRGKSLLRTGPWYISIVYIIHLFTYNHQ